MSDQPVTVQGLAYDATTRDWTMPATFTARNRREAIDWMRFNRDWMKNLHIVEPELKS